MTRILLILSIILVTVQSHGQARLGPTDPVMVHLFPNPAISNITFDLPKGYDKGYSLRVYNFLGKKMYDSPDFNQRTTLALTDFPRGVFIYQLYSKQGKLLETGKFQVSK